MKKATQKKSRKPTKKPTGRDPGGKELTVNVKTNTLAIKSIDDLMGLALREKAGIEQIQKFIDMKYRHEEREAKKEYFMAMSKFQAEVGPIVKDKHVKYNDYWHASLGQIVRQCKEPLAKNLLSYSFEIKEENGIKVTCISTHANGHSEKTSMEAGADTSGGKNTIQSKGSTITYLERYTFLARHGLVTADQDNDGNTSETDPAKPTTAPPAKKGKPEVLPPEKPEAARQAIECMVKMRWTDLRKLDGKKYVEKWRDDLVEFVGGTRQISELTNNQLTAMVRELEAEIENTKGKK